MATIFRRLLDKITPWHDDMLVNKRLESADKEVTRSGHVSDRAEALIDQYVLMDTIYKKRKKTP